MIIFARLWLSESRALRRVRPSHSNTQQQQQPFNGLCSGTTRVGRYQKKHSPTHTHPDHRPAFNSFLHLQRSIASSLFSLRVLQSSRTTSPGPLWFSPWSRALNFILHTCLHPIVIVFSQYMPIPTQLVLLQYQCHTAIIINFIPGAARVGPEARPAAVIVYSPVRVLGCR